jgi:rSAM/selenodomain-associated transferase 2
MTVSVIVPTLNEARVLATTLARVRATAPHQIIVVDGGSSDDTVHVATGLADAVLTAARGRATQMNAGAAGASGDVLVFLHADTVVPSTFVAAIEAACSDAAIVGGRFDVDLVPSSPLIWLTGWLMNQRSRLTRIATGDQAIFVRRETFTALGGFADIPLMEDIDLSRRLTRAGRVACLRERVTTSSRRWRANGVVRTILLMWTLRVLYFLGVSPTRLAKAYRNTRGGPDGVT